VEVEMGGDTLDVRLVGINAPERDECFEQEASAYLIDHAEDSIVGVETIGSDQFGRTLANLWLEEELLNLTIVLEGMAIGQTADDANPYGQSVLDAEEIAFQDEVGLWAPGACGGAGEVMGLEIDADTSVFDPEGPDDDYLDLEKVTIRNKSEGDIDMGGFTLRDESSANRYVFPEGSTIAVDGVIEVTSGCEATFAICEGGSIWNNGGDMVLVLDRHGNVVARLRY
jgi:hypothetical protein